MSVGIFNQDTSFFSFEGVNLDLGAKIFNDDIEEFSITEEMGKLSTGHIKLYDPEYIYSYVLRNGAKLKLTWGYGDPDLRQSALALKKNSTEFTGSVSRRGYTGHVINPGGSGSGDGRSIYNCNFVCHQFAINGTSTKVHSVGNRGTVIGEVLLEMGVDTQFILFRTMLRAITPDTAVRRNNETSFQFLNRLSFEWGAEFRLGFTPAGTTVAAFVDRDKMSTIPFGSLATGGFGESHLLEWKDGLRNVIQYNWNQFIGESGSGDSVQVSIVAGQPVFFRRQAEEETVITWRLVPSKIEAEFKRRGNTGGLSAQASLMREIAFATDFTQVQRFFIQVPNKTAPQGVGYKINVNMLGNVLMTAPNKISFGLGFPARMQSSAKAPINFFIKKAVHVINKSGYKTKLEIQDAFSVSGGSLVG